jgi:CelD/BcsL family acetyltransferase involved in cellulose biosynthesis
MNELEPRADEWNELVAGSMHPNIFLTWEWVSQWWRSFGRDKELHVIALSDACGRLVALCPLWRSVRRFIPSIRVRTLRFVGDGGPTFPEYLGAIVRADCAAAAIGRLLDHILEEAPAWDMMHFPGVSPEDMGTRRLIEMLQYRAILRRSTGPVCPSFLLPRTYDEFLLGLSRHGRQRERRLLRQAHKEFHVDCKLVRTMVELHEALPIVVNLHNSSRARHGESSPFARMDYLAFHKQIMERCFQCGFLRLFILQFDGRPVAFQYGFVFGGTYYDFQSGFDGTVHQHNPGDVLLQLIIQNLIAAEVREFDFLRGEHAYKCKFSKTARRTEQATVFRRRGLLHLVHQARRVIADCRAGMRASTPLHGR